MFKVSTDGRSPFPLTNLQLYVFPFFFENIISSLDTYRPLIRTCTFPFIGGATDIDRFGCDVDVDDDIVLSLRSDVNSSSPPADETVDEVDTFDDDFLILPKDFNRFVVEVSEFFLDEDSEDGKLA